MNWSIWGDLSVDPRVVAELMGPTPIERVFISKEPDDYINFAFQFSYADHNRHQVDEICGFFSQQEDLCTFQLSHAHHNRHQVDEICGFFSQQKYLCSYDPPI